MWADTLAAVEQRHLLTLLVWSGASVLAGTAILAWLYAGSRRSALLRHFGIQCGAWGLIDGMVALLLLPRIHLRDLSEATRLDRLLWLNVGLDVGTVCVGGALVCTGWAFGRRLGVVGAGIGVMVQGCALLLLHLLFVAQVSR
jgi:hypothetical protein